MRDSVSTAADVHQRQESRHQQQLQSMRTEAQTVQTQHASEIGQLQSEKQALESENALLKREQAKAKEQLGQQQCVLALPCALSSDRSDGECWGTRRQLIDLFREGLGGLNRACETAGAPGGTGCDRV